MEKSPLVSVVIPMYNAHKFILTTLNSVFNQTFQDFEVIVVDDCSKDNSVQIVESLQKEHKNLILIKNDVNKNVAETRNVGVKNAKGKFVAFLDADDAWEVNKLELQLDAMQKAKSKLSYTSSTFIDDAGNSLNKVFIVPKTITYKSLLKQNIINMSSSVVDKNLCLKYPFHNPEVHEDFIFWLQILKNEKNVNPIGLQEVLSIQRFTIGSKSRNKWKSVKMTYKTYKVCGINFFKAHFYLACYMFRSFKKYFTNSSGKKKKSK